MKKILLALMVLGFVSFGFSQTAEKVVKFSETKHNFGKIKQGVPVTYDFSFTNISAQPLIIENATASCGCTTPTWPQQPIMKSQSDKVKAGFNAAAPGPFEKTVFVKIKGVDAPLELKISGEVLSAEEFAKQVKK
ncbi:MAG: hypothetical protein RLY11_771 [Bacteroidota bacterium]|jgi:Protein of unknown function (DUF1573)|nr:DUF1573 domain-containing protein [Chitinophagia bacterium]